MTENELTPSDLEPEFIRVGTTWQAFADLVRQNQDGRSLPSSFAITLNLQRTLDLLRSLPDGAGQVPFAKAWEARFVAPALERKTRAEANEQERREKRKSGGGTGA